MIPFQSGGMFNVNVQGVQCISGNLGKGRVNILIVYAGEGWWNHIFIHSDNSLPHCTVGTWTTCWVGMSFFHFRLPGWKVH